MDRVDRIPPQSVIPVDNETTSSALRTTAEGRHLTYQMTVLQQPVRARACGQGAKSSADRRPVDPPPIVELRIFEGEDKDHQQDITFTMHANYFLFATLEQARPMAHGRVAQERSSPPVLTGTPVAGMVYLDRPSPAGYFIFPDLSVRHEGKYRLSFSLYEELKNAKDADKVDEMKPDTAGDAHVTHRLEVKSEPFHVYSAKKFPGLTESTSLSRMVAEQGCRVRIRRDVRMRRRDTKGNGKEWDEYEEETAAARARASTTPDPNVYGSMPNSHGYMEPIPRPRSASNASHHSLGTSISRRPSLQEMGQGYHQSHYGTAPHTPQNGYNQASSYGPSPTQQYQQAPYVQQPQPMQPPPPQYQSYPPPPPPPGPATAPQQSYYSGYAPAPGQPSQQQYSAPAHAYEAAPQPPRSSVDYSSQIQPDYRRGSTQLAPPQAHYSQQPVQPGYPSQAPLSQQAYQPPPPPQQASQRSYQQSMNIYNSRPAPLHPPTQSAGANTSTRGSSFDLPPINTGVMSNNKLEASSPISAAPQSSSYYSGTQTPMDTHKRSFGNVFSDRHQNGPLRQGARPSVNYSQGHSTAGGVSLSAADDNDDAGGELNPDALGMHYRRADGRQILRALPGHG